MIITVASSSEGVGKSIIAVNVAVLRALVGRSVLLLDIDPKKSSFEWSKQRDDADIGKFQASCRLSVAFMPLF